MIKKSMPILCPSCGGLLAVHRLECSGCGTAVEGSYQLPVLACLAPDDQTFLLRFIKCSGNLKEMAKAYGVSYPTVRNRLDTLIDRVITLESGGDQVQEEETNDGHD